MRSDSLSSTLVNAYNGAKILGYALEGQVLYQMAGRTLHTPSPIHRPSLRLLRAMGRELALLLQQDYRNIQAGIYPMQVLAPGNPLAHLKSFMNVAIDSFRIAHRRNVGKTADFPKEIRAELAKMPRYYRRNFHFQSDGYLSHRSAELYDHQVNILFCGTADVMRRLVIRSLREKFGNGNGDGKVFLEIGAGTGRGTHFVAQAFPKARIIASDLSKYYLKYAQSSLGDHSRIEYLQGDGASLPLGRESVDAVFSIFLFHELPLAERMKVIHESLRILRPGGIFVFVDSLQKKDTPALDELLVNFQKSFHEPFYRNYLNNPMERLMKNAGLECVETQCGFCSKVCSGSKPKDLNE
jgi:ubiquinone/menaquinone biosynthesis C-methylase UbiE